MEEKKNEQIDLLSVVSFFKAHVFKIIFFASVGAILMLCYAMFFVTPKYKSSVQLLVTRNENIERQSYQNETKTNIDMIPTYKEIVMSEPVLEKVKETTGGQVGVAQLKKNMTVEQTDEKSQTFGLTLKWDDPKDAQEILTNITDSFTQVVQEVYGDSVSKVVVLSKASYNPGKVEPNLKKYVLIGTIVGSIIAIAQSLYVVLSDSTVNDAEFLESMNLIVLGELYEMSSEDKKESRYTGLSSFGRRK